VERLRDGHDRLISDLRIERIRANLAHVREEIAGAVAYLADPASGSTMGAALVVDGGYVIR